jgi:hypothetical protein
MRKVIFLASIYLVTLANSHPSLYAQGAKSKSPSWRPATYQGLTIGKSTRADMLRVLGKPLSSGPSADQSPPRPIIWNDYGRIEGELSGRLAVEVDSRNNRVVSVFISTDNMSREDVIKYFGNDYLLMGYDFCKDQPDSGGVGIVYENPASHEIQYIEYRSRGIAIHVDQGRVSGIYFVSGPMGLVSESECRKEIDRLKKKSK